MKNKLLILFSLLSARCAIKSVVHKTKGNKIRCIFNYTLAKFFLVTSIKLESEKKD